jgi:alpha-galactosidase
MREIILTDVKMNAVTSEEIADGMRLRGTDVALAAPFAPVAFYRHGWQSWSLTAWLDPKRPVRPIFPKIIRPQADDPRYAEAAHHGGAWVGAVRSADGQVLLLGALGLDGRVELRDTRLHGFGAAEWFAALGTEAEVFARYAELLGETFGRGRGGEQIPTVWCSWYGLYTGISEANLLNTLEELGDLPFDVFQIDDGWQKAIGDWTENEKFPSGLGALTEKIHATGRKAGLWLAPLLVDERSELFRQQPDWLLRDENGAPVKACINWGGQQYALDTSHPSALVWLADLMKQVRAWGFDYAKLDFLYAGALPGKRRNNESGEQAYRNALSVMREALGDAYLLTCGAPIVPSLGLCDAIRVGPDVASYWENALDSTYLDNFTTPGTRNAIRTSFHRLWFSPLAHVDPDVAYFRSEVMQMDENQRGQLQKLAQITGFKATSDLPKWLNAEEREQLRVFWRDTPKVERVNETDFRLDGEIVSLKDAIALPPPAPGWFVRLWAGIASSPHVVRVYTWVIQKFFVKKEA